MNTSASNACTRLTVAIERLYNAIEANDRIRRKPAEIPEPLNDHSVQACMDAESFDLDWIIRGTESLACAATHRARAIERLTDECRKAIKCP